MAFWRLNRLSGSRCHGLYAGKCRTSALLNAVGSSTVQSPFVEDGRFLGWVIKLFQYDFTVVRLVEDGRSLPLRDVLPVRLAELVMYSGCVADDGAKNDSMVGRTLFGWCSRYDRMPERRR